MYKKGHKVLLLIPYTCRSVSRNVTMKAAKEKLRLTLGSDAVTSPLIKNLGYIEVVRRLNKLEEYKISQEDIVLYPEMLKKKSTQLGCAFQLMEEVGLKSNIQNLKDFQKLVKEPIKSLKKSGLISEDVNVLENLLSYTGRFPFNIDTPLPTLEELNTSYQKSTQYMRNCKRYARIETKQNLTKDLMPEHWYSAKNTVAETEMYPFDTISNIVRNVLRQYVAFRLDCELQELDKRFTIYNCWVARSLRDRIKVLDILEFSFLLPKLRILNHMYLLNLYAEDLMVYRDETFYVAGKSFKELAPSCAKLLTRPKEEVIAIENLLKKYGITDEMMLKALIIFTIKYSTLRERLDIIKSDPEMMIFLKLKRAPYVLFYFNKFIKRYRLLKSNNARCLTLDKLIGTEKVFNGNLNEVSEKTTTADLSEFLQHELNTTRSTIRKHVSRHPYKHLVPLVDIQQSILYLRQLNFTDDVIIESLPLVLYPKEKIDSHLQRIESDETLNWGSGVHGVLGEGNNEYECGTRGKDKRLALCLYFIEKEFHFTGEGIWK